MGSAVYKQRRMDSRNWEGSKVAPRLGGGAGQYSRVNSGRPGQRAHEVPGTSPLPRKSACSGGVSREPVGGEPEGLGP